APNPVEWVDPWGWSGWWLRKAMEAVDIFRPLGTWRNVWQTHHLIPQQVWKKHRKFFNEIGMRGREYGKDGWRNGLYMPSSQQDAIKSQRALFHRGSHNKYNARVDRRVEQIKNDYERNLQGGMCEDKAKGLARDAIQNLQDGLRDRLSSSHKGVGSPVRLS
ncbi:AHH domain-containing protein, partial [Oligella urethralis]